MIELFVDTAGWGHLLDRSQAHHQLAKAIYEKTKQQKRKIVTSSYVLSELVPLVNSRLRVPKHETIRLVKALKTSPHIDIVYVDSVIDTQAWGLLEKRLDKDWSLVDCSSMIIMQQRNIEEVLTTDHHFIQAGFTTLLPTLKANE